MPTTMPLIIHTYNRTIREYHKLVSDIISLMNISSQMSQPIPIEVMIQTIETSLLRMQVVTSEGKGD